MPLDPSDLLLSQIDESYFKEDVTDITSARVDTFSCEAADLEMTFLLTDATKLKAALQWIIGVDYVGQDLKLHRTNPMFHPVHTWAWAKSVRVRGKGQRGDDTDAVVWPFQSTPSKWEHYQLDVTFEMTPGYEVWGDDEVANEMERYVSVDAIPAAKLVSVDGGQIVYDVPGSGSGHGQIHVGMVPICRKEGAGYRIKWFRVPVEFIASDIYSLPTKLLQAQGKVNSTTFFGAPAECMLCTDAKIVRKYVSPLTTDVSGGYYWLCDVEMEFEFLKQLDSEVISSTPAETRRGHNLWLSPGMKWRYALNSSTSQPVYPKVDLTKLFTHYTDTF